MFWLECLSHTEAEQSLWSALAALLLFSTSALADAHRLPSPQVLVSSHCDTADPEARWITTLASSTLVATSHSLKAISVRSVIWTRIQWRFSLYSCKLLKKSEAEWGVASKVDGILSAKCVRTGSCLCICKRDSRTCSVDIWTCRCVVSWLKRGKGIPSLQDKPNKWRSWICACEGISTIVAAVGSFKLIAA